MSIYWQIDKEDVVFIYKGILFSHKKEWKLVIRNDMNGAREYYAKRNKIEKKNTIWFHSYVECKKQNKRTWVWGGARGENQETPLIIQNWWLLEKKWVEGWIK